MKNKTSCVRIPYEHLSQLRNIAAKRQIEKDQYCSVSELVKEIIARYLKEQKEI